MQLAGAAVNRILRTQLQHLSNIICEEHGEVQHDVEEIQHGLVNATLLEAGPKRKAHFVS